MRSKTFAYSLCGAMGFIALQPLSVWGQVAEVPANPVPVAAGEAVPAPAAQDAMQILEQGPIHEAFAEPVVLGGGGQLVVDRAPPDPINEVPPEVRPEGGNIEWISGYWMWSDQKTDFIWVSGVWRDIPPGRRWVPGHWAKADAGFEWVPGFWAGQDVQEVRMLPTPPETLEAGPSSPAPGDNYFWVPGVWVWQNGGYGWRAGYWYAGQQDWVWVPDHYCYSSYGAIFVNGYWDYPLVNRGLLYAPVYYSRPIYGNAGYFYRPRGIVNTALLLTALFVNSNHNHYYYGYGGWGNNNFYRPWWSNSWGRGNIYDPFYSYHRWHDGRNRNDWHDHVRRDWDRHHRDWDRGDRDGDGRGGRGNNFGGQVNVNQNVNVNNLVRNVDEFRRENTSVRLRDLTAEETQQALARSQNWQRIREARVEAERNAGRDASVGLNGNAAADLARRGGRGQGRNADGTAGSGARAKVDGDLAGRVGANEGGGRRLRVDTPEGGPRGTFRLPPVERSADGNVQAGGEARRQGGGATSAQQARAAAARAWQSNRLNTQGNATTDGGRRINTPSGSQVGGAQDLPGNVNDAIRRGRAQLGQGSGSRAVVPGADASGSQARGGGNSQFRQGRSQFQQGGNLSVPGGGRVEVPQGSTSTGRSVRSNPGNVGDQGQATFRSGGGQSTVRVPSGVEQRSFRVPSGSGGSSRSLSVPSGGGQPQFRGNPGGGSRSFQAPSGGSQRSIQVPSGGQRSIQVPSGGQRSIQVPSGGSSFRGFSGGGGGGQSAFRGSGGGGGQSAFRSGGGGGGGQQMSRGGGGGGGQQMSRGGGGGGGREDRGGGGGGGRGRGRGRD